MLLRIGLISISRQLSIGRCEKPAIIAQLTACDSPSRTATMVNVKQIDQHDTKARNADHHL